MQCESMSFFSEQAPNLELSGEGEVYRKKNIQYT